MPEPRAGLWVQPTPVKGWAAPLHPGAPTMLPEVWAGPVPLSCHRAGWHSSSHIPLESPCTPVPRCGGTSCPCSCRDLPRGATFHTSPAQHCGVSPCATCPVIPWHWAEPAVPWHWGLTPNYPCANPEPRLGWGSSEGTQRCRVTVVSSGWFLRGPLRALLQDLGCSLPRCSREQQQLPGGPGGSLVAPAGPRRPRQGCVGAAGPGRGSAQPFAVGAR